MEIERCSGGRVVQRPVLHLGEINDSRRQAWCRLDKLLAHKAALFSHLRQRWADLSGRRSRCCCTT